MRRRFQSLRRGEVRRTGHLALNQRRCAARQPQQRVLNAVEDQARLRFLSVAARSIHVDELQPKVAQHAASVQLGLVRNGEIGLIWNNCKASPFLLHIWGMCHGSPLESSKLKAKNDRVNLIHKIIHNKITIFKNSWIQFRLPNSSQLLTTLKRLDKSALVKISLHLFSSRDFLKDLDFPFLLTWRGILSGSR